ncbi:hypothetical protein [Nocardioides nanhaiensis]|uniref:DUF559 domain-containing protein n=1 Tax=Nocardioides nanhaiensis TaxID=1476871 RepID=A0ABP8VRR7_9ACTN
MSVAVTSVLEQLGGVATRAQLLALTHRSAVDRAIDVGDVAVVARGRYVLARVDRAPAAAHRVGGHLSHLSAALHHGWSVLLVPPVPQVTVPRYRRLSPERRRDVELRWATLESDEVRDGATTPDRTLGDCLRHLPAREALAVADSALRSGYSHARLARVTAELRGTGAPAARSIAARADGRAANPFESALRAVCLEVAGLRVRPQVSLHGREFLGRPDLVDVHLRIVLEADSFTWHGDKASLEHDACRSIA